VFHHFELHTEGKEMEKTIVWETDLHSAIGRGKDQSKAVFLDFHNPK
jgi:hypothetical protein